MVKALRGAAGLVVGSRDEGWKEKLSTRRGATRRTLSWLATTMTGSVDMGVNEGEGFPPTCVVIVDYRIRWILKSQVRQNLPVLYCRCSCGTPLLYAVLQIPPFDVC